MKRTPRTILMIARAIIEVIIHELDERIKYDISKLGDSAKDFEPYD